MSLPPSEPAFSAPEGLPDDSGAPPSFPVSFAQQRLWFLHNFEPEVASYNLATALRLTGALHVEAMEKGINEILKRHDALRTCFPLRDGRPVQVISPARPVAFPEIDLRQVPSEARERETARLVDLEANASFDLANGPLFRSRLFRLADEQHVLILTMHHIVSDGWSVEVLLRELAALYDAFRVGQPSPLPELPIQYADYALWQQNWMRGEVLESQLAYWKEQLAGIPAVLDLPTDRPRPPVQSSRGATISGVLPPELHSALNALARGERTTLFTTLLAAFHAFLSRYTGQSDVPVGSPIAGRTQLETEDLIGFFVNTLVLRGDLSGNPTFRQLLARVRETALEAYAHQDLPFEKLVEELRPDRSPSHNPLFQVLFQLVPVADPEAAITDLKVESFPLEADVAKFDLSLRIIARPNQLSCHFEYKTALFEAETIRRMLEHWKLFLAGVVADPDRRVWDLPLMGEAERSQILVEWNATTTPYPREGTIHGLFEEQVEKTPDADALVFGRDRLSYRELNERANQLARYLSNRGVGPESFVGLCVNRSLEMVVGLLGILKAGGAYLPLDPSYPRERLAFMLEEAGAPVLLTQDRLLGILPEGRFERVPLDRNWPEIGRERRDNPASGLTAENLAYVIYTSGSTGEPKGVPVPHRGVLRLLLHADYARLGPDETFVQLAPISFDASTFEIWGALLHGATCVLFPERNPTPEELERLLKTEKVTTLWLTASLFNAMIDAQPSVLSDVRQLLIGGEALSIDHVRRALELLPATQIINGYGPTESTTFTCCYRIPRDLPSSHTSVPIGRPIANTRVYLLDQYLNPVPIGVSGELHIGGDGLARGYWSDPVLTGQKFIPDPFPSDGPGRIYKTGDRARYLSDGNIEFLGRLDSQVKIRGHRIEPGEIEAVLRRYPGVRNVAVIAREDDPQDRRLVAYVVTDGDLSADAADLRAFLAARLPAYMVPSAFIRMEALPLTPSGKLDRRALPAPGRDRAAAGSAAPPRDAREAELVRIWEEVLGVRPIGVHDNFFELGGHSLLAIKFASRVRDALQVDLPLRTIFEAPTIAGLSKIIEADAQRGRPRAGGIPAVSRAALGGSPPVRDPQERR